MALMRLNLLLFDCVAYAETDTAEQKRLEVEVSAIVVLAIARQLNHGKTKPGIDSNCDDHRQAQERATNEEMKSQNRDISPHDWFVLLAI